MSEDTRTIDEIRYEEQRYRQQVLSLQEVFNKTGDEITSLREQVRKLTEEREPIRFQSAASGLWYTNPFAAGTIMAIKVGDKTTRALLGSELSEDMQTAEAELTSAKQQIEELTRERDEAVEGASIAASNAYQEALSGTHELLLRADGEGLLIDMDAMLPLCRFERASEPGDSEVGMPPSAWWEIAKNQDGTLLAALAARCAELESEAARLREDGAILDFLSINLRLLQAPSDDRRFYRSSLVWQDDQLRDACRAAIKGK